MKNIIFLTVAVMVCAACQLNSISSKSPKEEQASTTWEALQQNMVPGAEAGTERPFPNVLSEQEVLLKAVDYAYKIGAFDPAYYLYQENPALLNAKIETPVLIYHVPTGTTNVYSLTAVDNDGTTLIDIYVRSTIDADMNSFEVTRATSITNTPVEYSTHYITKREAVSLIESQFPDKQVSDPIAIMGLRLEGSRFSNIGVFWYFTVSDNSNSRSADGGSGEEYIIDSVITGWKNITGGVSNRAAISSGDGGSPYLNWNRMARLDTPLRISERIEAARSAGGSMGGFTTNPVENVKYTPVPLR